MPKFNNVEVSEAELVAKGYTKTRPQPGDVVSSVARFSVVRGKRPGAYELYHRDFGICDTEDGPRGWTLWGLCSMRDALSKAITSIEERD